MERALERLDTFAHVLNVIQFLWLRSTLSILNCYTMEKIPKCNEASNIFLEFTKYKTRGEYHRYCTTFPFSGHYDCPKIAFQ